MMKLKQKNIGLTIIFSFTFDQCFDFLLLSFSQHAILVKIL